MTALDTTTVLPVVRPAAPVDEQLTGPPSWQRLVVWLAGWDKRREDWWKRWRDPSYALTEETVELPLYRPMWLDPT